MVMVIASLRHLPDRYRPARRRGGVLLTPAMAH
jgi:hypothetical protein